jgi:hypothetical protein
MQPKHARQKLPAGSVAAQITTVKTISYGALLLPGISPRVTFYDVPGPTALNLDLQEV